MNDKQYSPEFEAALKKPGRMIARPERPKKVAAVAPETPPKAKKKKRRSKAQRKIARLAKAQSRADNRNAKRKHGRQFFRGYDQFKNERAPYRETPIHLIGPVDCKITSGVKTLDTERPAHGSLEIGSPWEK